MGKVKGKEKDLLSYVGSSTSFDFILMANISILLIIIKRILYRRLLYAQIPPARSSDGAKNNIHHHFFTIPSPVLL